MTMTDLTRPTRRTDLRIYTLNARSLCSNAQVSTLIKYDIIGVSETKRDEAALCDLVEGGSAYTLSKSRKRGSEKSLLGPAQLTLLKNGTPMYPMYGGIFKPWKALPLGKLQKACLCSQSYCTEHRFSHGCDASRVFDPSIPSTSAPLRPFLCSKEVQRCFIQIRQVQNCSNGESISITCAHCDLNFCLRHRHPGQHNCQNEPKEAEKDLEIAERLRKMHEMLDPIVKREKKVYEQTENSERNKTAPPTVVEQARIDRINAMKSKLYGKCTSVEMIQVKNDQSAPSRSEEGETEIRKNTPELPPVSVQQQKEDKIAVMKLKLMNKSNLGVERQILFVDWPSGRKPIFVHKAWTLGKAISTAKENLKLDLEGRIIYKRGSDIILDTSDIVGEILKDEDTIVLQ